MVRLEQLMRVREPLYRQIAELVVSTKLPQGPGGGRGHRPRIPRHRRVALSGRQAGGTPAAL